MHSRCTILLLLAAWVLVSCRLAPRPADGVRTTGRLDAPKPAEEPDGIPTPSETPPTTPLPEPEAPDPAAAEERDRDALERAHRIVESAEAGAFVEADDELRRFEETCAGHPTAELLGRFLRDRLDRALAASSLDAPETQDFWKANEKLLRARDLVAAGKDAAARDLLEDALASDPGNTDVTETLIAVLKRLGLEHYSRGDTAKATAQWRRALELRAGDEEVQHFIERAEAVKDKL